jgi:putative phosphoserine phosphatase/1-acylglycerol-3-phosphate O-acyltransferase
VDTSEWRSETIDEHVAQVRDMFSSTLGQHENQGRTVQRRPHKKITRKKKRVVGKPAGVAEPSSNPAPVAVRKTVRKKAQNKKTVAKKAPRKKSATKKTVRKTPGGKKTSKKRVAVRKTPGSAAAKPAGSAAAPLKKKALKRKKQ